VADSRQFGNPKLLQFGDRTAGNQPGDGHCAECEAMLADALDGTLSVADRELFDAHMAGCGPCSQMLGDARRGAAFLEMLRTPAPEPPAALLERILAQTSGAATHRLPIAMTHPGMAVAGAETPGGIVASPGQAPGYNVAAYGNVLPFPRRAAAAFRSSSFGQILLQPRLAMTAAMAFFSIALTMNITGVHLQDLRASDLKPSSLKRDFASANASVVRYYEGLRVVYELESRVHDLESAQDGEALPSAVPSAGPSAPAGSTPAPAAQPGPSQQPGRQKAAPQPGSQPGGDQPGGGQPARKQIAPAPYTSRREEIWQNRRLLVAQVGDRNRSRAVAAFAAATVRVERTLV